MKNKVLVIVGPTALGKTDLGLRMAKKFDGELIACDSRQVYKGLKIGAGKGDEVVRLYDIADPKKQYSVAKYVEDAHLAIGDVLGRGRLPIIVGGTGLYLRGLLGEIPTLSVSPNKELRGELDELSLEDLQSRVIALSPTSFSTMNDSDKKNKRRLIRRIELFSMNPYIDTNSFKNSKPSPKYDVLKIGLIAPRLTINNLIDQRILARLDQGMVDEAKALNEKGLSLRRMKELGLEYGIMAKYLEGAISYEQMTEELKSKIRQYAKRQLVWFRKDRDINWFDIEDDLFRDKVAGVIKQWYDPESDA